MPAADVKELPIKIAIIGAGNVDRSLGGAAWLNGGHDVAFGVRNPADPEYASLGNAGTDSAAEVLCAGLNPSATGAHVCTAMNQIGAPMMDHPQLLGTPVTSVTASTVGKLGFGFGLLRGRS